MIMKSLSHLFSLFYPNHCVCCSTTLLDQEKLICLACRFDLPFIDNENYTKNAVTKILEGRVSIQKGASFLYYHETGKTKQLIHELKYRGNQTIGSFIGNWFGKHLLHSNQFNDIDCIIPVPLHKKKLKKRGYNQLTEFGKSLSCILQATYLSELLQRVSFTHTQTRKKRLDRFQNTESKFVLKDLKALSNKHVLLIDDVITTGATLEACCNELQKTANIKISIVTMAITA